MRQRWPFSSPLPSICIILFLLSAKTLADDALETIIDPAAVNFGQRVCTSKNCAKVAATMFHSMDETVQPCQDFVAYACGNYHFHHDIVGSDPYACSVTEIGQQIRRKLVPILKEAPTPNDKPWVTLAKNFYKKCKASVGENPKSALQKLKDDLGGWPLLDKTTTGFTTSWEEYLAMVFRKTRIGAFIVPSIGPTFDDTSKLAVNLQPTIMSNHKYDNIKHLIRNLEGDQTYAKNDMNSAEYQKHQTDYDKIKDLCPNGNTNDAGPLSKFKTLLPNFDVEAYLKKVFEGIAVITPETQVNIECIAYFQQLHTVMTNKKVIANRAVTSVVFQYFVFPYSKMLDRLKPNDLTTDQGCLKQLYTHLKYPMTQMWVKEAFNRDKVEPKVVKLLSELRAILKEDLKQASWLDDATRANAIHKLENMRHSVGYPENLFDEGYMTSHYTIDSSDPSEHFLTLFNRILQKRTTDELDKMNHPIDERLWDATPIEPNAFHTLPENKMIIAAAILQPNVYLEGVPEYANYAGVGFIVGHEMMHGFDSKGRHYDEKGNVRDWWTPTASQLFQDKTKCFIDQYNGKGVNGALSLHENIADNVGFPLAYKAYKKMRAENPDFVDPALPGFESFTPDQMFFLKTATDWCDVLPVVNQLANDPHPAPRVRIRGVLENMPEFSAAFNCPAGSPMNPSTKCAVW